MKGYEDRRDLEVGIADLYGGDDVVPSIDEHQFPFDYQPPVVDLPEAPKPRELRVDPNIRCVYLRGWSDSPVKGVNI